MVADGRDKETGLKIYSLYQSGKRKPTPDQLKNLDALIFDIQDIGCRFYTYISTMGMCMEAARENGLKFIVLDRVNPINARTVDGPVRLGESSFTAFHEIPVRHGMTAGELATMFRAEREWNSLDLKIIRISGWKRHEYLDELVVLPWINPSPNMRSMEAAVLYPGVGLSEFTNLSVGRGTKTPFELVGAPYIDPQPFAAALNAENLPGLEFIPIHFTPDASKFKDQRCGGVRIVLTNRNICPSVSVGIAIARALRTLHPDDWEMQHFNKLLAHQPTFEAVANKLTIKEIQNLWLKDQRSFLRRRAKHLLY